MKFAYQLGGEMTAQEQHASATYQIGRVVVTPAGIISIFPVVTSTMEIERLSAWDRLKRRWRGFILWLRNRLARLQ